MHAYIKKKSRGMKQTAQILKKSKDVTESRQLDGPMFEVQLAVTLDHKQKSLSLDLLCVYVIFSSCIN